MDEFDLLSPESQGIIAEPPSSLPENYRRALEFKNKRMMEAAAAAQLAKDVAGITASFQGRGPTNVVAPMEIRNTALSPEQSAQIDLDAARRARIASIGGGQVDLRNPSAGPLRMGPVPQQADPNADYGADEQARRAMMAAKMREVANAARQFQRTDPSRTYGTRYGREFQSVPDLQPENEWSLNVGDTTLADTQLAGKDVLQNAIARDKAYEQKKADELAARRKEQREAGMDPMQLARARALESLGVGGGGAGIDPTAAVLLGPEFADAAAKAADLKARQEEGKANRETQINIANIGANAAKDKAATDLAMAREQILAQLGITSAQLENALKIAGLNLEAAKQPSPLDLAKVQVSEQGVQDQKQTEILNARKAITEGLDAGRLWTAGRWITGSNEPERRSNLRDAYNKYDNLLTGNAEADAMMLFKSGFTSPLIQELLRNDEPVSGSDKYSWVERIDPYRWYGTLNAKLAPVLPVLKQLESAEKKLAAP